jgi:hypothetical protein
VRSPLIRHRVKTGHVYFGGSTAESGIFQYCLRVIDPNGVFVANARRDRLISVSISLAMDSKIDSCLFL